MPKIPSFVTDMAMNAAKDYLSGSKKNDNPNQNQSNSNNYGGGSSNYNPYGSGAPQELNYGGGGAYNNPQQQQYGGQNPYGQNPNPYGGQQNPYGQNPNPYGGQQPQYGGAMPMQQPAGMGSGYGQGPYQQPPQQPGYLPQQQQQYGVGYPPQQQFGGPGQYGQQYGGPQQQLMMPHSGGAPQSMATMFGTPSVKPAMPFNSKNDAEALRKAMKGFGTDNAKVIQILCSRSNGQRQEIAMIFKTMYGKDLISDLKSELSGDFEDLILALMEHPAKYDAHQLHKAMAGLGTKESVLIEIMCSRTNGQIFELKNAFRHMYNKDLEHELKSETSGYFQRLLISMCAGFRDESMQVDPLRANQDARTLLSAGEKRLGTDESQFIAVLASNNFAQLRLIFQEYAKVAGKTLEQSIHNEFSGDIKDGLLTIVKCVANRPAYFAEKLYQSMKGFGTHDNDLIRVVVTRCEYDMADIRREFQRMYNQTLEQFISSDCSGNYKNALLTLVKGN